MTQQERSKRYYDKNKERIKEKSREQYKKYYAENREKILEKRKRQHKEHPAYRREYNKYYYEKNKSIVYSILGCECVRCGFSDSRALQIDHIEGRGNEERREVGSNRLMEKISKMDPIYVMKKYQVLCANCNWIKRHEKGEHK